MKRTGWRTSRLIVSNHGLGREWGALFCPPSVLKTAFSQAPQWSLWWVLIPLQLKGEDEQIFQVLFQDLSGLSIQTMSFSEPEAGHSQLALSLLEILFWCLEYWTKETGLLPDGHDVETSSAPDFQDLYYEAITE